MKFKELSKIELFGFSRLLLQEGKLSIPLKYEINTNTWHDPYDGTIYTDEQIGEATVVDIQARGYCQIDVSIQF